MKRKNVLLLKELTKIHGNSGRLDHFFLEINSSEIMNLIGLEGSGKQSVYSILFGEECADFGAVWFDGKKYPKGMNLPVEQANGIFFIGNKELIIPELSVAENLYIIEKMNYFQLSVSRKKMEEQARRVFEKFDVPIDAGIQAKRLNRCEWYILRLMRAYVKRAKLIVVDDIMDDFLYHEISQIIEILERFKQEGISILWINSYPDNITEVADKTVIIREGHNSCVFYHGEYDRNSIINNLIMNERAQAKEITQEKETQKFTKEVFSAKGIHTTYFDNLEFSCMEGEILGIYDLKDRFSREFQKVLLGRRNYSGDFYIDNQEFLAEAEFKLAQHRVGIMDGRKYQELLFEDLSMYENIGLGAYNKIAKWGCFLSRRIKKYMMRKSDEICKRDLLKNDMKNISRGDAVKIVFNRWKVINPRILFCFHPYLRLDVLSRQWVENMLLEFQKKGTAVVLTSGKISELLPLCDRILVVKEQKILYAVNREDFDIEF